MFRIKALLRTIVWHIQSIVLALAFITEPTPIINMQKINNSRFREILVKKRVFNIN